MDKLKKYHEDNSNNQEIWEFLTEETNKTETKIQEQLKLIIKELKLEKEIEESLFDAMFSLIAETEIKYIQVGRKYENLINFIKSK